MWLLDRFGVDESVTGDLVEQLARGRSQAWFWRQALGAVVLAVYRDCRMHPFLVARSLLLGLVAWSASTLLWISEGQSFNIWIWQIMFDAFGLHRLMLALAVSMIDVLLSVPVWFAIGWLTAASSRNRTLHPFLVIAWFLVLPHSVRQAAHAVTDLKFGALQIVVILITLTQVLVFTASVLAGALCGKERRRETA
jgi:hypothetical protein